MRQETTAPANARAGPRAGRAPLLLPRTLTWILLVYAGLVLISGWTYSALRIRTDRENTLQTERNRLSIVAEALEAGTVAILNDGMRAALTGAREIATAGGLDTASEEVLRDRLQRLLTGGQYIRSVFVADATRFARAGAKGTYEVTRVVPAWLTAAQSAPSGDTWVGKPIPDPEEPGAMVVPVARHVPHQRAELWAGALFSFRSFEPLRAQLEAPGSFILLLSEDGTALDVLQDPGGVRVHPGGNYASSPLFKRIPVDAPTGLIEGFAPLVGAQMVFVFVRAQGYPVLVASGLARDSILAPWRERTRTTLILTAVPSVLVLALTLILNHFLQALRRRELHYRTLFNNATFGVLLLENERLVAANDTAVRMFGLADAKAVVGMTPGMLSPPRQPDGEESPAAARQRIGEALSRGAITFEWQCKRHDSGAEFPAEVDLSALSTGTVNLTLAVVHDLTERKRAEQERRESDERYRALVDALPEAVFVHRGGEGLLFLNEAARKLVGASTPHELIGRSPFVFADDADREALSQRTREILARGTPAEPREARIRRLDGSVIWVEVQGVRVQFAGAPAVQSVMREITTRKEREAAEAARNARMQRQSDTLVRLASQGETKVTDLPTELTTICVTAADVLQADRTAIWLLDEDARVLRCAEVCSRQRSRPGAGPALHTERFPTYLEALRTERVIASDDAQHDARLDEVVRPGIPFESTCSVLAAGIRRSGELAGVVTAEQLTAARMWQPDEISFAAGVADQVARALLDSQREQVLADLRILAGELMRIQDEERRRIGRDLHDSTGQSLAALEIDLERLSKSATRLGSTQRELLGNAIKLARLCATEIRTASYLLHPPLLDELGLVSALRWLADGLRQRGSIEVQLELPEALPRLRPDEELTLFRIAQEALTNVHRHSASPWAAVRLTRVPECIRLEIEDAGRGLAIAEPGRRAGEPTLGVGLAGMRERIRQVGGTFTVHSAGSGTLICATIPFRSVPLVRSAS